MNFSRTKNATIPNRIVNGTEISIPICLVASGIRWINASPRRVPAEKLTKKIRKLCKAFRCIGNVIMPIKDTRLTIRMLPKRYTTGRNIRLKNRDYLYRYPLSFW